MRKNDKIGDVEGSTDENEPAVECEEEPLDYTQHREYVIQKVTQRAWISKYRVGQFFPKKRFGWKTAFKARWFEKLQSVLHDMFKHTHMNVSKI